jgi:hypothetical protein
MRKVCRWRRRVTLPLTRGLRAVPNRVVDYRRFGCILTQDGPPPCPRHGGTNPKHEASDNRAYDNSLVQATELKATKPLLSQSEVAIWRGTKVQCTQTPDVLAQVTLESSTQTWAINLEWHVYRSHDALPCPLVV